MLLLWLTAGLLSGQAESPAVDDTFILVDGAADKKLRDVERERDKWDRDLRRIIEDAFDDKTDLEIVETPKAERKQIAKAVLIEADTRGIAASIARIEQLIAEYIRREREELEDEEAMVMLLMAA